MPARTRPSDVIRGAKDVLLERTKSDQNISRKARLQNSSRRLPTVKSDQTIARRAAPSFSPATPISVSQRHPPGASSDPSSALSSLSSSSRDPYSSCTPSEEDEEDEMDDSDENQKDIGVFIPSPEGRCLATFGKTHHFDKGRCKHCNTAWAQLWSEHFEKIFGVMKDCFAGYRKGDSDYDEAFVGFLSRLDSIRRKKGVSVMAADTVGKTTPEDHKISNMEGIRNTHEENKTRAKLRFQEAQEKQRRMVDNMRRIKSESQKLLTQADLDGDGQLTLEEFTKLLAGSPQAEQLFDALDVDGSGVLERPEVRRFVKIQVQKASL